MSTPTVPARVVQPGLDVRSLGRDGEPLSTSVLDPRDYHVFEARGRCYFFDVSTGTLAEINAFARRLLAACGQHSWDGVGAIMSEEDPEWSQPAAEALIESLRKAGLLKPHRVDAAQQSRFLGALWAHNPRRLQLLVAQLCNLKCLYCYEEHNGSNARRRLMSFEVARAAVDYLVEKSQSRAELQITFFGGEPLLNFKVIQEIVAYCRTIEAATQKTFTFEVITNATLLTEVVVDYLVEHRFSLMISMDGYREMHTHNRPSVSGRDMYDTILANAKRAVAKYRKALPDFPVKLRSNLTHEYHDLEKTVRYLESEGFRTIGISTVDSLPWTEGNLHACTSDDLDEIAAQQESMISRTLDKLKVNEPLSAYENKLMRMLVAEASAAQTTRGLKCGVGRNTNIVDCEGKIYPCHRYGDLENFVLGDIYKGLDRERTMAYYESVNTASVLGCASCWARTSCGGPCAWLVSNPTGTVHLPTHDHCDRIRRGLEQSLALKHEVKLARPDLIDGLEGCGGSCGCNAPTFRED